MNRVLLIVGNLLIFFGLTGVVLAQSSSPDYSINESYIGPGGTVNSQSAHYGESSTVGDIGTGGSSSTNYQVVAGVNTTADPRLVLMVNTSSIGFGQFSISTASTATSTFKVLNYTASGYSVYTLGQTPSNGSHHLTNMATTAASQVGVEQFGINLRGNSSPISFGTDPLQVPSGSFSFGTASSGYDQVDNFRYVDGERIAQSVKTSGETDYTISYVVNVSTTTPGGVYSGNQQLLVVGSY